MTDTSTLNTSVVELYQLGFSARKIAEKLNINSGLVQSTIKDNSISLKHKPFSDQEIPTIIKLYQEGVSAKNLAIIYEIDRRKIFKYIEQNNVPARSKDDSHRLSTLNQHIFDKINTTAKAYWLGFLTANGSNKKDINTICFTLKGSDAEHLRKLSRFVELDESKVSVKDSIRNNKPYNIASLSLYSKYLCLAIEKFDDILNNNFLEYLDKSLHSHFVRGLFDGNGSINCSSSGTYEQYKWSLNSTKEMLLQIQNYIKQTLDICVGLHCTSPKQNTWSIAGSGNVQISKFMRQLYENSDESTRLDRKYEQFLELEKFHQNKADRYKQ